VKNENACAASLISFSLFTQIPLPPRLLPRRTVFGAGPGEVPPPETKARKRYSLSCGDDRGAAPESVTGSGLFAVKPMIEFI